MNAALRLARATVYRRPGWRSAPTVPAAFGDGQWSWINARHVSGQRATLTISALPRAGGMAITAVEARIDGGAPFALGGTTGTFQFDALGVRTARSLEIRAVNAIGPGPWSTVRVARPNYPAWAVVPVVNTGGTAYLTHNSAVAAVGTNSQYYELLVVLRDLDIRPAVQQRLATINGRHDVNLTSTKRLAVNLLGDGPTTLVAWTSSADAAWLFDDPGLWAIRIFASLGATPSLVVERRRVGADTVWETVPGSYSTGPLTGTLTNARSTTGADYGLGATHGGASIYSGGIALIAVNLGGAPVGREALYDEYLVDPQYLAGMHFKMYGPAADWNAGVNKGTVALTFTRAGTYTADSSDPLPAFNPRPRIGFGAAATGGHGGEIVRVTSVADSAGTPGSIRWALNQYVGQPIVIQLAAPGEIYLGSELILNRGDITFDGRHAPGNGCWLAGNRVKVQASNIIFDNIAHFGNDTTPDGNSDCFSIGYFSADPANTTVVDRIYFRDCIAVNGRDECFAFTCRNNDQATGSQVRNCTVENTLIGNNVQADHPFLLFVGDGCTKITFVNTLVTNGTARFPLMKRYADEIEFINCAMYNFNENASEMAQGRASFEGCLFRLGPRWNNARAPILVGTSDVIYLADTATDTTIGKVNSYGMTRGGGTLAAAKPFAGSGVVAAPRTSVASLMASVGPRMHGGGKEATVAKHIADFAAGDAPSVLETYPGSAPAATGDGPLAVNANGVPLVYLATYPADTDPKAIISEGGDWDGQMVAARIGDWLVSSYNT